MGDDCFYGEKTRDMLENGLEIAREISAPYVESGWEMTADFVTKTKELSVADLVVKTKEISVNMRERCWSGDGE